MPFKVAGPAEILRAAQKDEWFCDQLVQDVSDVFQKVAGSQLWMKWRKMVEGLSRLAYHTLTTVAGYQTLGEEYTGIVQVDRTQAELPSTHSRMLMVLFHTFGATVVSQLFVWVEWLLQSPPVFLHTDPQVAAQLLLAVRTLKYSLLYIQRLHLAVFYLGGMFYHISKRVTQTHYVLVRNWLGDGQSLYGFKLLGYITLCHLLLSVAHKSMLYWKKQSTAKSWSEGSTGTYYVQPALKCPLCLDVRKCSSATPCGHLFCWECIMEWLQTRQECPLCRKHVQPSRVIPLQNYHLKGSK